MKYKIDGSEIEVVDVDPANSSWKVFLNGEDVTEKVSSLAMINEQMGLGILYGSSLTGKPYNQPHRYSRGCVVVALRVIREASPGNLIDYVVVLEQMRPIQGPQPIHEFPRGQLNFGEVPLEAAFRELYEETGISSEHVFGVEYLGSTSPDSAIEIGETVHCFLMNLHEKDIDWKEFKIKSDLLQPVMDELHSEMILGMRVIPLIGFVSQSGFTNSALAFMRAFIDNHG